MNLSQRQLRMFVTTATLGNISRASEALHISQPALSRALQEFEAQLGVTLFVRTTRRLGMTHEGAQFLATAQRLLADMEQAIRELREQAKGLQGTVTLAVGTAFGCTVLPRVLREFGDSHPGVRLRLIDDNGAGITARVARAEVDLGIGSPMGDTGGLLCRKLLSAPVGLLGDATRYLLRPGMTPAALQRLPLLNDPAGTSIANLLHTRGSELTGTMARGTEVSSLALQLALANAGVGIAVVSALGASHPQAAALKFVPLKPAIVREVFLIHRRDRPPSASTRAFVQALDQVLAAPGGTLHPAVKVTSAGART